MTDASTVSARPVTQTQTRQDREMNLVLRSVDGDEAALVEWRRTYQEQDNE